MLKPVGIILLIILVCLFPKWPFIIRLIVFYISYYFLIFTFVFSNLRLLIYLIACVFGYSFWILPEIFNDHIKPYYSLNKKNDSSIINVIKGLLVLGISGYFYTYGVDRETLQDIKDKVVESHHELVTYGKEFIKFDNSKKLRKRGIAYEDLLKITEDTEA